MKDRKIMHEHTIICPREMMCWFTTISEEFRILKDLEDNTFQVFFRTTMSESEIESNYGISLGWVAADDH